MSSHKPSTWFVESGLYRRHIGPDSPHQEISWNGAPQAFRAVRNRMGRQRNVCRSATESAKFLFSLVMRYPFYTPFKTGVVLWLYLYPRNLPIIGRLLLESVAELKNGIKYQRPCHSDIELMSHVSRILAVPASASIGVYLIYTTYPISISSRTSRLLQLCPILSHSRLHTNVIGLSQDFP